MLKAKPPRPKTCKHCKTKFQPARNFQSWCSADCAVEIAKAKQAKQKAQEATKDRRDTKERKEKLKDKGDYTREAQKAFNEFIRWRDRIAGHTCISSGKALDWTGNAVDAGHYRSVGSAPHLRFEERNCHAQTKRDNRYLSGNAVDYRLGLIERMGLEAVEALEADQEARRYTIEDLKEVTKIYRAKVRELKRLL